MGGGGWLKDTNVLFGGTKKYKKCTNVLAENLIIFLYKMKTFFIFDIPIDQDQEWSLKMIWWPPMTVRSF